MPVHDWGKVDAGAFHSFHTLWIAELTQRLNGGALPEGFFAMAEQHAGRTIADVLTLKTDDSRFGSNGNGGGTAVMAAPTVGRRLKVSATSGYRALRKTIAVRHVSGRRVVAMIEIVSPSNKDRRSSINDFVSKARTAIEHGCHLLVIDLFPPGPVDPGGMHEAIWEYFGPDEESSPIDKPLTLAA